MKRMPAAGDEKFNAISAANHAILNGITNVNANGVSTVTTSTAPLSSANLAPLSGSSSSLVAASLPIAIPSISSGGSLFSSTNSTSSKVPYSLISIHPPVLSTPSTSQAEGGDGISDSDDTHLSNHQLVNHLHLPSDEITGPDRGMSNSPHSSVLSAMSSQMSPPQSPHSMHSTLQSHSQSPSFASTNHPAQEQGIFFLSPEANARSPTANFRQFAGDNQSYHAVTASNTEKSARLLHTPADRQKSRANLSEGDMSLASNVSFQSLPDTFTFQSSSSTLSATSTATNSIIDPSNKSPHNTAASAAAGFPLSSASTGAVGSPTTNDRSSPAGSRRLSSSSLNSSAGSPSSLSSSMPTPSFLANSRRKKSLPMFRNQVAGHTPLLWNAGTIYKPLIPQEKEFYQKIREGELPSLAEFVPLFYGTIEMEKNEPNSPIEEKEDSKTEEITSPRKEKEKETPGSPSSRTVASSQTLNFSLQSPHSTLMNFSTSAPLATNSASSPPSTGFLTTSASDSTPNGLTNSSSSSSSPSSSSTSSSSSSAAASVASPSVNRWAQQCQQRPKKLKTSAKKEYIVLEDLTFPYDRPNILDLKLGTRQHGEHDSPAKVQSKMKKCQMTTSASLGLRLCGMQVYYPNTNKSVYRDKYYGRQLNQEGFRKTLKEYFSDGTRLRTDKMKLFLQRLYRFRDAMMHETRYRFYASSLLLVYEGNYTISKATSDPPNISAVIAPNSATIPITPSFSSSTTSAANTTPATLQPQQSCPTSSSSSSSGVSAAPNSSFSSYQVVRELARARARDRGFVDARIIDFAHTARVADDGTLGKTVDSGLILGFNSLIECIESLLAEAHESNNVSNVPATSNGLVGAPLKLAAEAKVQGQSCGVNGNVNGNGATILPSTVQSNPTSVSASSSTENVSKALSDSANGSNLALPNFMSVISNPALSAPNLASPLPSASMDSAAAARSTDVPSDNILSPVSARPLTHSTSHPESLNVLGGATAGVTAASSSSADNTPQRSPATRGQTVMERDQIVGYS